MPKKRKIPWSRYLPAAIIFGVGVGLSLVAFVVLWEWEDRRRAYEFNRTTDVFANRLEQQLEQDLEAIRNVGDFTQASISFDRAAFEQFVSRPLSEHPTLKAIAWVERIEDPERYAYEDWMRGQVNPRFEIVQRDPQGKLIPRDSQPEYFPISYIAPRSENESALGFELSAHAAYRAALWRARQTGEMVVTELLDWQIGRENRQGVAIVQPVYDNTSEEEIPDPAEQTAAPSATGLRGFVVGWLGVANLLDLAGAKGNQFNIYLCDETGAEANPSRTTDKTNPLLTLYEAMGIVTSANVTPGMVRDRGSSCPLSALPSERRWGRFLPGAIEGSGNWIASRRKVQVDGRQWALYVLPTEEYQASRKHWRSWAVLIIGFLWTHIPVTYLLTSVSRTAEIEALAAERAKQAERLQQAFKQLEVEQAKSERLLLNVLPKAIAERLKQDPQTIAESYPEVTVLFADIVGFTKLSARISPTELVQLLNDIFSAFDALAEKHGLEKIKTIGDAYMVVGGLPVHRRDHAEAIAEMALDMQAQIAHFNDKHPESFAMRIGIHTGPAIAGVIGTHKFIYDIWGDTVNVASRMESHGLPGRIQVSATTYEILRDKYCFQQRGPIPIKGKGETLVYLLWGRQKEGVCQPILALPSHEMSTHLQATPRE